MTASYPITERRSLGPADRIGLFRRSMRTDLPKPDAHHELVYRVNGGYVRDRHSLRGNDDDVINATHVSIVDTRRNAPVTVGFSIASADAASFDVTVTFICTVTDSVAVVRDGVDAHETLWGYLQAHSRIFDLGLDYRLSEVNELRRAMSAQITAYSTIKPPTVSGMTVSVGSVTVQSPEYLAQYEERHRGMDVEGRLALKDQENQQRLAAHQMLGEQSRASTQQVHVHHIADQDQAHNQRASASASRHRRRETAAQNEFDLEQFSDRIGAIGTDPRRIIMAAFASGQIDATTMAERIVELNRYDAEAEDRRFQLEHDQKRELEGIERSEDREKRAAQREDDREIRAAQREDDRWEREQRRLREDRDRDDAQRREEHRRADDNIRYQSKVELLKQAANNGHFDQVNLQADRLYAEVVGLSGPAVDSGARTELPSSTSSTDDESATRVTEENV